MPSTLPNALGWYFADSPHFATVAGGIRHAPMGAVVQVNWRLPSGTVTPHTMFVYSRTASGVDVIESNWAASLSVRHRFISFADFDLRAVRYTVYKVISNLA